MEIGRSLALPGAAVRPGHDQPERHRVAVWHLPRQRDRDRRELVDVMRQDRDQGRGEGNGVFLAVLGRGEAGHALDDADRSAHMDDRVGAGEVEVTERQPEHF